MTLRDRLRRQTPGPRPVRIAESSLMGRSAVAVVMVLAACPTAFGQLAGAAQGSRNIDELGVPHLADTWAVALLLAAVAMLGSYLARRPDDTRVLEVAANGLVVLAAAVHLAAILNEVGWSGSSWVSGLDLALIVNCGGRAWFLVRQLWWVRCRSRA